jgi:hypothetical protein
VLLEFVDDLELNRGRRRDEILGSSEQGAITISLSLAGVPLLEMKRKCC